MFLFGIYSYMENLGDNVHGTRYTYNCNRVELSKCIRNVYYNNSLHNKSHVMKNYVLKNVIGPPSRRKDLIFFKNYSTDPDYYIYTYIMGLDSSEVSIYDTVNYKNFFEDDLTQKPTTITIKGVFRNRNNKLFWKNVLDFDSDEKKEIEDRFKNEILDKMVSDSCNCELVRIE